MVHGPVGKLDGLLWHSLQTSGNASQRWLNVQGACPQASGIVENQESIRLTVLNNDKESLRTV